MSTTQSGRSGESAVAERRIAETEDGYKAAVRVEGRVDAPLVVRVVDGLPAQPGVEGIRISPDAEPERWTVEGGRLVFEALVPRDEEALIVYDLRADDLEESPPAPTVELAQPVEADGRAGEVPSFRDAQSFDAGAAGEFVSTDAPAGDGPDADASTPSDGSAGSEADASTPSDGGAGPEASDDDVRRAIEAVTEPETDEPAAVEEAPTIDLDDPDDDR